MQNALATVEPTRPPVDNWDAAADEMSPVRGTSSKFDNGVYSTGREKTPLEADRKFIVIDRAEGWQFLKKDCQPEWVMRSPGEPRPEQPFVDESAWPIGLSGEPEHPWKWTLFIYLVDAATGESLTFSTSTAGGRMSIDELTTQIKQMRNMRPGAVPIVTLESRNFKSKFGTRPRPFFKIEGWKVRAAGGGALKQLTSDNGTEEVNAYDDDLPF